MEHLGYFKMGHRLLLSYERGRENEVLRYLCELVEQRANRETPFDWFDVACLSHQLGLRMKEGKAKVA
jgi:hypothetical protein